MIPAGLQPGEVEFGKIGNHLVALQEGVISEVADLSKKRKAIVDNSMNAVHHEALDELKIYDQEARRYKFLECNNSNWDFTADISDNSETMKMEYVDCGKRGNCFVEGRLCQPVLIEGVKFRMSELRVMAAIRKGHSDKEICCLLKIKPDTLRSHKRNITFKLKADRKLSIAVHSIKYGIS
jgi:DNA-binding CsgD family transcriptional regulator